MAGSFVFKLKTQQLLSKFEKKPLSKKQTRGCIILYEASCFSSLLNTDQIGCCNNTYKTNLLQTGKHENHFVVKISAAAFMLVW